MRAQITNIPVPQQEPLDGNTPTKEQDIQPEEREVKVWVLLLDSVKDLLSPEINISVLKVEVLLALVEGFGGIFYSLMLDLKLTSEAGHFEL